MSRHPALDWIVSGAILLMVASYSLTPLYWVVATSIKPAGTEFRTPVEYVPQRPTLENYATVLAPPFTIQRAVLNSVIVSSMVTVGAVFLCSLAGYAIARLRFRYKISSLLLIQLGGMVPPVVVIAPTFVLMRSLGLLGTLPAMILPNIAYNIPIGTWLLAAYFISLPPELEDAARVDGCTPFGAYWRVILPLAAPGLFSAGVLAFLGSWGEFMLAFTVTRGAEEVQTVPAAIISLSQGFELQWAWVSAGIVVSLLPVIVLAMVFQRWVVQGLTTGTVAK